jgi:hypothetical protein
VHQGIGPPLGISEQYLQLLELLQQAGAGCGAARACGASA